MELLDNCGRTQNLNAQKEILCSNEEDESRNQHEITSSNEGEILPIEPHNGSVLPSDPVRRKCIEMFKTSLQIDTHAHTRTHITTLATQIEAHIYNKFNTTGPKYKKQVKSRILNLRDSRNKKLHEAVLTGETTPEQLAVMSHAEMACEDARRVRECDVRERVSAHMLPVDIASNTGKYVCGGCGGRNTSYSQVDLRGNSDLVTFVCCNSCGRRWKGEHLEYGSADVEEFEIT